MASKKKHIGSPGYGPKEEKHFERARKARLWNEDNIKRFERVQCHKRDWIKFADIAKSCSELDGSAVPNEAARENAYTMLKCDLLRGRFEEGRRSHVRFVYPRASIRSRMTRKWLGEQLNTTTTRSAAASGCSIVGCLEIYSNGGARGII